MGLQNLTTKHCVSTYKLSTCSKAGICAENIEPCKLGECEWDAI